MRTIGLLSVVAWAVLLVNQVYCQAPQDTLDKETQTIPTTPATSVKKDADGLDRQGAPRRDRLGDPLPPDATARLGTIRLRHRNPVTCAQWSPDGKWILSGSHDCLALWDAETGKRIRTLKTESKVLCVRFSSDGKRAVSGGGDLILWDLETGKRVHTFDSPFVTTAVLFSPDAKRILAGGTKYSSVPKPESPSRPRADITAEDGIPMGFSGTSNDVDPTGKGHGAVAFGLSVWDAETRERLRSHEVPDVGTASLGFSADGRRALVARSERDDFEIRAVETWKVIRKFRGGLEVNFVDFSPAGDRILAGSDSWFNLGGGGIWDADSGEQLQTFGSAGPGAGIDAGCFSPDGKRVVWSEVGGITLSDAATGKRIRSFIGRHVEVVQSLSFRPDGKRVLSASKDRSLGVWDVETGKRIHRFEEHHNDIR